MGEKLQEISSKEYQEAFAKKIKDMFWNLINNTSSTAALPKITEDFFIDKYDKYSDWYLHDEGTMKELEVELESLGFNGKVIANYDTEDKKLSFIFTG
jgi:hypothetical protein